MTSIEWLMKKITNEIIDSEYIDKLSIEKTNLCRNYVKKSKEMHKQEIIDAWNDVYGNIKDAEQYYQETFVSKESGMSEKPNNHIEPQISQTEISDEEIEKAAQQINLKYGASFAHGFIMAIKWYREQLKQL
jgi:dTDP-glucose pyrophosphorylase